MKKLSLLFLIYFLIPDVVFACTFIPNPDNINFIASDIVQTSGIDSWELDEDGDWKVSLSPIYCHKGKETNTIYIPGNVQMSSCRINLSISSVWVLFLESDSIKNKKYLSFYSGSRSLGAGEFDMRFDSTLIYDTTVFTIGHFIWFRIMKNSDERDLQLLLDSCAKSLDLQNRVALKLIISRHGEIKCDTAQFEPPEPELIRQIDAFFEDKRIEPIKLNGTSVNIQVLAVLKVKPPLPH